METPDTRQAGEQSPVASQESRLHFGWSTPPFLHELPVDAPDAETAAERLHTLSSTLLPEHSAEGQGTFALLLAAQVEEMAEGGVISAGMCFLEVDGQPTASTLQVTQLPHDSDDHEIIDTLLGVLRSRYPHDEIAQQQLPCGPAVTRIGPSHFALRNAETGEAQPVHRNIIQAYIPLPEASEMLLFELGVFSQEGWDLHSEVFAEILKSVEWATEEEIRAARSLARTDTQTEAGDGVDEATKEELEALSGRIAAACWGSASLAAREDVRTSGTTCQDCWQKGLRSVCVARHEWRPGAEANVGLQKAASSLTELGWTVEDSSPERLELRTGDYTIAMSASRQAAITGIAIVSACKRMTNTTMAEDFG